MAQPTLTPLPPADAIAALTRRGQTLSPTFDWREAWQSDHAQMFTVAKSAGFDVLKDIHDAMSQAIGEGQTFEQFSKNLKPVLEQKGWWGRKEVADPDTGEIRKVQLGSPRRLRTIFDTNMRVSYAAGHWAQFERNIATRPVLRYVAILDGRVRPAHAARHNLTLPVDDPYWDTWAPPCGWGCRCSLQSLSLRDVERMKGELKFTPPAETMRSYVNKRTGELVKVPDGIDPGWGYNPGRAAFRASFVADKVVDAPPPLAAVAQADQSWPAEKLGEEFGAWLGQLAVGNPSSPSRAIVGALAGSVLGPIAEAGTVLRSGALAVEAADVPALLAGVAGAGEASASLMAWLPIALQSPRAIFMGARGSLQYLVDVPEHLGGGQIMIRIAIGTGGEVGPNAIRALTLVPRGSVAPTTGLRLVAAAP